MIAPSPTQKTSLSQRAASLPALYRLAYARRPHSRESSFVTYSLVIEVFHSNFFFDQLPPKHFTRDHLTRHPSHNKRLSFCSPSQVYHSTIRRQQHHQS
jgi:hypothetical protein